MQLSSDQTQALNKITEWFYTEPRPPFITLGGYAGTGKTTLIGTVKERIVEISQNKLKIAFCSYTGKATQNLKVKLQEADLLRSRDTISTIHGLIYVPIESDKGVIVGWDKKEEIEADIIIVDEASMIDSQIWQDLLSYRKPIIAVGDHGQLPPIRGSFNLMHKPDLKLEEIHRQAKDDPIITVSIHARNSGNVPRGRYGKYVVKYTQDDMDFSEVSSELLQNYNNDMMVLCGYNSTRNKINQFIRNALGFDDIKPQIGDRVICLRNNHKKGVYNGMLGTLVDIKSRNSDWYEADIQMDDSEGLYSGKIYAPQFGAATGINFTEDRKLAAEGDLFDFGYALTVHKAQGSQAKKVVLFEERFPKMDDDQWKRWLYTGVTRAEKELYIFGPSVKE